MEENIVYFLRWILIVPLLASLVNGFFLKNFSYKITGSVATCAVFSSFLISLYAISQVGMNTAIDPFFTWIDVGRIFVPFHLEYTPITAVMLMLITGIGTLIHLYSISYMSHDKSHGRYFCYLNLFIAAMLVLVLSSNLVAVFLGWEGVGLCSYLLIGFWFDKKENAEAGKKAFLINRIGDLGFFIALFILMATIGTTEIRSIIEQFSQHTNMLSLSALVYVAFYLFWASTGKSAQFPLYVWLPDAMAGPTPVSALIHAATMVTSGIFISVRLWPLFASQTIILNLIMWIGFATSFLAALIALSQVDIKKVLAYSTVSQLGFMFFVLGLGAPHIALFHVFTHAFFKALLFLSAGSVIHGMSDVQDMNKMGGLRHKMKWTHLSFLVGTLAIIGFPLTAGFFSKDLIMAEAYVHGPLYYGLILLSALMTSFYMLRAYSLCFWGSARSKEAKKAHESSPLMLWPLGVLAFASLFFGWFQTPEILGHFNFFKRLCVNSWYVDFPKIFAGAHHMTHFAEWVLVLCTSGASLLVAYFSFKKYSKHQGELGSKNFFSSLSVNKFYVDEIYSKIFVSPLNFLARLFSSVCDGFCIDGFLHSWKRVLSFGGTALSALHVGKVQFYAFFVTLLLSVFLLILVGVSL